MIDTTKTAPEKRGKLIVVSGPSGVGKGTVCEILKKNKDELNLSVSVSATQERRETTRKRASTTFSRRKTSFRK